jgi:hypothetical protein
MSKDFFKNIALQIYKDKRLKDHPIDQTIIEVVGDLIENLFNMENKCGNKEKHIIPHIYPGCSVSLRFDESNQVWVVEGEKD